MTIRIFNQHTGTVQFRDEHWLRRMRPRDLKSLRLGARKVLERLRAGEVLETEHEWWREAQEHE